jgi:hypothetical protein
MNKPIATIAFLFGLAFMTLPVAARATPLPLSAIPLASEAVPRVHEVDVFKDIRQITTSDAYTDGLVLTPLDEPVCVRAFDGPDALGEMSGSYPWNTRDAAVTGLEVDQLVVGTESFLDRVVVNPSEPRPMKIVRRARVPLVEIVDNPFPVFAYRTKDAVHILVARGFEDPIDAFDPRMGSRSCGLVEIRLAVGTDRAGRVGVLPAHAQSKEERWTVDGAAAWERFNKVFPKGRPTFAPLWMVNASLSKVSRDPEPLLSVMVQAPAPSVP